MSIAFNAATDGGIVNPATSLTYSHTAGAGSDRLLCVAVWARPSGTDPVTGVTYNGVAMTQANKAVNSGQQGDVYLYFLVNPASGAHNVVVSSSANNAISSCAADYTGVSATGQPDATAVTTNDADSITTTMTTVIDNCWGVLANGGISIGGTYPQSGTGCTMRAHESSFSSCGIGDSAADIHPAGSYSMTATRAAEGFVGGQVIASFAPATSPPPPPAANYNLPLLGVGD